MTEDLIQSTLIQLIRKDIREKIKVGSEGEPFITITSKTGNEIQLALEHGRVDLIFGLYGEDFPFPEKGGEVALFKKILKFITDIIKEELVSIRYMKWNWMNLR